MGDISASHWVQVNDWAGEWRTSAEPCDAPRGMASSARSNWALWHRTPWRAEAGTVYKCKMTASFFLCSVSFDFGLSPLETLLFAFSASFLDLPGDFVLTAPLSESCLVRSLCSSSVAFQTHSYLGLLCCTSDPVPYWLHLPHLQALE